MTKIPIKIVRTQDMAGNKKISIMADLEYQSDTDDSLKIQDLKAQYMAALIDAKKSISDTKTKKPSDMWTVSTILKKFADSVQDDFIIHNYTKAIRRDLNLGQYTGVILRLSEHIGREKITDMASMCHYGELLRARTRLAMNGAWDYALECLVEAARTQTLPNCKTYRQDLAKMDDFRRGRPTPQSDIRKFA